ncbi:MAG: GreA/GreB family elongation factor, partial [Woeseiaceae bacterium]
GVVPRIVIPAAGQSRFRFGQQRHEQSIDDIKRSRNTPATMWWISLNYDSPQPELHDMGRWRPPPPKSSPYITPAGFAALQAELKDIWVRRREVVSALSAAAAEGDRSENAEYIYRKKELGGLDYRIRYLQKRLPDLNVVRESPNGDAIYFGAYIELRFDSGDIQRYRIVGPDEADAKTSAISIDSPLARSLLKKRVDDKVEITIGEKTISATVSSIHYERHESS